MEIFVSTGPYGCENFKKLLYSLSFFKQRFLIVPYDISCKDDLLVFWNFKCKLF